MILGLFTLAAAILEGMSIVALFTTTGDFLEIAYFFVIWLICAAVIATFLLRKSAKAAFVNYVLLIPSSILLLFLLQVFVDWFSRGYPAVVEEWKFPDPGVALVFVG